MPRWNGDRNAAGRWDLVSLGEVMLRLDPGVVPVRAARSFCATEGGGEYNVARNLRRSFGMDTAIVTSLVDNPIGRLIEDLMLQGGVSLDHVSWVAQDGVADAVRNGLNFTDRGFGVRPPRGCSDRSNSAASRINVGTIDWSRILAVEGTRWFHTGGVFAALSDTTPDVALEGIGAARRNGAQVSFDINYRPSLWEHRGGPAAARVVNSELIAHADVLVGSVEDVAMTVDAPPLRDGHSDSALDPGTLADILRRAATAFPNLSTIAVTSRVAHSASVHRWTAACYADREIYHGTVHEQLQILDRVGGGDAFASGLIYGLLTGRSPAESVEYGLAHGAVEMTTPGDSSMTDLETVEHVLNRSGAKIFR